MRRHQQDASRRLPRVGVVVAAYVMERVVDLLAERLGLDPLELRRRNMLDPEDLPYVTATGARLDTGSYVRSSSTLPPSRTTRRCAAGRPRDDAVANA